MSNQVRCIIGCPIYIHVTGKNKLQYIIIYYVSEHQLPPVIDASHTTPITRVNRNPKLLKLIDWRHCPCFRWVPYIPRLRPQFPGAEPGHTARYLITVTVISLWKQWNNNSTYGMSVIPQEPCSGTLSRLCNLYLRSNQNIKLSLPSIFPIPV